MNDQETVGLLAPTAPQVHERRSSNHQLSNGANHDHSGESGFEMATANCAGEMDEPGAGAIELVKLGVDWPVVVWIVLVHALAVVAPFFFSWQAILVCAVLIFLTGSMGVCMGYHRCLTHKAFETYRPIRCG